MSLVQEAGDFGGADYGGILRRRWWIVVALTCAGVAFALAYTKIAPKAYTATAQVYVTPTAADLGGQLANAGKSSGAVNLDTEAQIVQSGAVATRAAAILKSPLSPAALSKKISITVPPNTEVLNISCNMGSPTDAVNCANAFAVAYLANRRTAAGVAVNNQLSGVAAKIATLEASVAKIRSKFGSLPKNSTARLSAQQALSSDRATISALQRDQGTLNGEATNNLGGYLLTHPSPPSAPSSPKKLLVLPSGLIAGLLIGLIAAFVVDRRDRRVRSAKDLRRNLDVPVMLDLSKSGFSADSAIVSARSRNGQAITELAHEVAAALGHGNHVVLVAGTGPSASSGVVATNLAVTLARMRSEVVLVCANLSSNVAPALLGLGKGPGLAELAAGSASLNDVVRGPADMPGLWVITPGQDTALALYNLGQDNAEAILTQLRRDARYVVIEALATDEGSDTLSLAALADAAVVTVEVENTEVDDVSEAVQRLRRMRTPVLGTVVCPVIKGGFRPRSYGSDARMAPRSADMDGRDGPRRGPADAPLQGTSARRDPGRARDRYGDPVSRNPGN